MKIGDKISVLDENLQGVITSFDGDFVIFLDDYGFTQRYHKEQIILQNPSIYENIKVEKKYEYTPVTSKKSIKSHLVLDLHFEKLVSNPSIYDSFERLFIQKEKLLETLDFCKENNIKKLEIIHGIGDGTLQKMVYDVLHSKSNLLFDDHDFFYHQQGSVMVEIR